ncbi:MAG: cell division protein ZapB [Deltaproteobacteria bacterium]|nr:cell division protein ZapB [Deltaproteobacteria bacterium]
MAGNVDNFEALEGKIIQLMEAYASLKNEKNALGEQITQKEKEIQSLREKIALLSQEREKAKEKLENLLNRLDRLLVLDK